MIPYLGISYKQKKINMKKILAILAIALFIGGLSVPVIAANNNAMTLISLQDDEPKTKTDGEKTEKKAETSKEATKSGAECSTDTEKKAETPDAKKAETAKPATSGSCG